MFPTSPWLHSGGLTCKLRRSELRGRDRRGGGGGGRRLCLREPAGCRRSDGRADGRARAGDASGLRVSSQGPGCVAGLPSVGRRPLVRAGGRGRQGTLRLGVCRPAACPLPRGPRESKAKASWRRGLRARAGGGPGGGGLGAGGCCQAPHPARGPRTPPELPGASLKAAPARLFSPFFVTL